ncbi:BspA family leucine-rich repeat surface protein [Fluviicola chungangensis]|uniref:BspA family leucine-rich repeat surface protein n=1 Tax=Fluviicola chungangensis TaxID=2597671 RepID=A0A556N784_9FLAO|nr:BspA family leucine-rich repeat surface protein [Fluviicola chungangensis]TSJ47981.1 BspA family leucine-rich repeat surface protein [Fluviicola chungangensis]
MKSVKLLLLLMLIANNAYTQMVLEHHLESVGMTVELPLKGPYNVTIDWGDGSKKESFQEASAPTGLFIRSDRFVSHTYSNPGTKIITITGALNAYGSASPDLNNSSLVKVLSWDGLGITSFENAFNDAKNLQSVPNTLPASVTNLGGMFSHAAEFNGEIGTWNTSNVTNMNALFFCAIAFNQPIGNWNTSRVTDMGEMFCYARKFNQPIGNWNTANVVNMSKMFNMAFSFNQPIENWNTSKVTDMNGMFCDAVVFNQPIGKWNTGNVTKTYDMFNGALSFNQQIGDWNMSRVTTFNRMFLGASEFNQPLNNWNTESVTNMSDMFAWAMSFNQPIGNWNVSNVTKVKDMFRNANSFDQDLSNWKLPAAVDKTELFWGAVETPRIKGAFKKGRKIGTWNYYYENGKLEASGNYDNNGFPQIGSWVFYTKSGKVEPDCGQPDKDAKTGFCHQVYTQQEYTGPEEGGNRFNFDFQHDLWELACADPSYNSFEVARVKIQIMWLKNRENFIAYGYVNSLASDLNVTKLDVDMSVQRLLYEAQKKYYLDMNFIDPADNRTLMDFVRDQIKREMGYEPIYVDKLKEYERMYYLLKKYLNAKTASELKN